MRRFLICFCLFFIAGFAGINRLPMSHMVSSASAETLEPQSNPPFIHRRDERPTPAEEKLEKSRDKAIRKSQYESLKKETDKLLQLASELKQSVDKSSENTLSIEVINKTEEVEKLAKKVRGRMKGY